MLPIVIWVIFPYTVLAIVGMGLVWQYNEVALSEEDLSYFNPCCFINKLLKGLLVLTCLSGFAMVAFSAFSNEPIRLFQWVMSLVLLQPDMELVMNISIYSQVHFFVVCFFLLILAFTNKVAYLFKPHLYLMEVLIKLSYVKKHP